MKKRLRTLIALQALYYGCFIAWNCGIPLTEGKRPAPVVGIMPAVGFLALIAGRKGNKLPTCLFVFRLPPHIHS